MPLATIDQLKEYAGDIASDKDDVLLTRLVTAAQDVVENYCGRTFNSTNFTSEMYDGTGTRVLTLKNFPIVSVSAVLESGVSLSTGTDPVGGAEVILYPDTGQLVRPYWYWMPYRAWYSITYAAGFATVPASIVQACLDIAGLMLREKEHIGLAQKTSGTQTVTYVRKLPEQLQRALDGYSDLTLGRST